MRAAMTIRYELPLNWIRYDFGSVANGLLEAKATLMALANKIGRASCRERV